MIIYKDEILKRLCSTKEELKTKDSGILILGTGFDKDLQVGNDSIDLRIAYEGYVLLDNFKYINTLSSDGFESCFQKVQLSKSHGYDLQPGALLFIGTIERINLEGNLIGRVVGRSTYARLGLSVHCTQDKFSSGIDSIVGLQIINNTNTVLKIFPEQKLAQLMIEQTNNAIPYDGQYRDETLYALPIIKEKELEQYSQVDRIKIQKIPVAPLKKKRSNNFEKRSSLHQSVIDFIIAFVASYTISLDSFEAKLILTSLCIIAFVIMAYHFYSISNDNKFEGDT